MCVPLYDTHMNQYFIRHELISRDYSREAIINEFTLAWKHNREPRVTFVTIKDTHKQS